MQDTIIPTGSPAASAPARGRGTPERARWWRDAGEAPQLDHGRGGGGRVRAGRMSTLDHRAHKLGPTTTRSGPLAFAECMRANGVPDFPDPSAGRGALFAIPAGTNPAAPAFKTAQAKCQKLMGGGPPSRYRTHPSAQTLAKLVRIAECMRKHGIPQFPDPRTTVPSNARPPASRR